MQERNISFVMMIRYPLLYPAFTEVKAVLTLDGERLSLTALSFHSILKFFLYKIFSIKKHLSFIAVHTQRLD